MPAQGRAPLGHLGHSRPEHAQRPLQVRGTGHHPRKGARWKKWTTMDGERWIWMQAASTAWPIDAGPFKLSGFFSAGHGLLRRPGPSTLALLRCLFLGLDTRGFDGLTHRRWLFCVACFWELQPRQVYRNPAPERPCLLAERVCASAQARRRGSLQEPPRTPPATHMRHSYHAPHTCPASRPGPLPTPPPFPSLPAPVSFSTDVHPIDQPAPHQVDAV